MGSINQRREALRRDCKFLVTELQHLETEGDQWHDVGYVNKRCGELRAEIKKINADIAHLDLLEKLKLVSFVVVPLLWLGLSIVAGVLFGGAVFAVMFFAGVVVAVIFAVVAAIRNSIEKRDSRRRY